MDQGKQPSGEQHGMLYRRTHKKKKKFEYNTDIDWKESSLSLHERQETKRLAWRCSYLASFFFKLLKNKHPKKKFWLSLLQDLKGRQWYRLPDMPAVKSTHQAMPLDDWVVVLSGYGNDGSSCSRVFAFHTIQRMWEEWISTPSQHPAAASDGTRLIVVGGSEFNKVGGMDFTKKVYQLSVDRVEWKALPPMPHTSAYGAATVLRNKLYAVGQVVITDSGSYLKEERSNATPVQVLDLKDGVWSQIVMTSSISDRLGWYKSCESFVALDDLVISDKMVAYDTVTGESLDLPLAPNCIPRHLRTTFALAVLNGQLLAIGSGYDASPSRQVRLINPRDALWEELPSMVIARGAAAACTVNGVVYVTGSSSSHPRSMECFKWAQNASAMPMGWTLHRLYFWHPMLIRLPLKG